MGNGASEVVLGAGRICKLFVDRQQKGDEGLQFMLKRTMSYSEKYEILPACISGSTAVRIDLCRSGERKENRTAVGKHWLPLGRLPLNDAQDRS